MPKEKPLILLSTIISLTCTNLDNRTFHRYVPMLTCDQFKLNQCQKLNVLRRKTIIGQKAKSYVGPLLWNNLNKTLNTSNGLNAFKDYIKQHYFNNLKKKQSLPITARCSLSIPPENIRQPNGFQMFSWVKISDTGL